MNSKQSISVLLMLGLLAPLTACGENKEAGDGDGTPSPTVSEAPATKTPAAKSPTPSTSPKDEGGEGGEGK